MLFQSIVEIDMLSLSKSVLQIIVIIRKTAR